MLPTIMRIAQMAQGRVPGPMEHYGLPEQAPVPQMPNPARMQWEEEAKKLDEEIAKKQGEREKLTRAIGSFDPPKVNPSPIRPGAAGIALLVSALARRPEIAQRYMASAKNRENIRVQNETATANQKLRGMGAESDILGDQIGGLEKRRGEVVSEGRYQQSRLDALTKQAMDAARDAAKGKFDTLERIVSAKPSNEAWFPIMFKIAEQSGMTFSPEEKQGILQTFREGRQTEAQLSTAQKLLPGLRSGNLQARATAAKMLAPILKANPGFIGLMGQDPETIDADIKAGLADAQELSVNELLGKQRIETLKSQGDLAGANAEKSRVETKLKNFELDLKKEFGRTKFQKELAKLDSEIARANATASKATAEVGKIKAGKGLTPTADMTSWMAAQKEQIRAQREYDEVSGKVSFWNSVVKSEAYDELSEEKKLLAQASLRQAEDKAASAKSRLDQVKQIVAERNVRAMPGNPNAPVNPLSGPLGASLGATTGKPLISPQVQKLMQDAQDAIRRGADPASVQAALKAEIAKIKK